MEEIALVGAGFMARTHHDAWRNPLVSDRAEVTHVVSPPGRGQRFADDIGAAWAASIDDLPGTVRAVDICTPTSSHLPLMEQALERGLDVLVEKPVVRSPSEADALRALVAERRPGSVVMVAHVVRAFAGYRAVWDAADRGEIGDLEVAVFGRWSSRPQWAEWITDRTRSGGPLLDFLIHDMDAALATLGPAEWVRAEEFAPDLFRIWLGHAGGRNSFIQGGSGLPEGSPFSSAVSVMGSEGTRGYTFSPDTDRPHVLSGSGEEGPLQNTELSDVADPYAVQAGDFLDAVSTGGSPGTGNVENALAAVEVAWGAIRSCTEHGRTVALRRAA